MSELLERVVGEVSAAPHSAAALTLYALVSTLEHERSGYLFKLDKLRDLNDAQRQLAFGLIEMMVRRENGGTAWDAAKSRMDAAVRAG
ncbi:MAG: hypothetical protein KDI88_14270 [Gammaproteobacteria bacterium]|nr:hypothetical protein [Gammaproteobacteria bacterium]